MSEPPPKDKDDKKPAATPPGAEEIIIKLDEGSLDEKTQLSIKAMKEENADMRKMIQDMHTEQEKKKYEVKRSKLLEDLEAVDETLVEDYKDEKDLGTITTAITVAKRMKKKEEFDEIEGKTDDDSKEEDIQQMHWKPIGSKKPTAKMIYRKSD